MAWGRSDGGGGSSEEALPGAPRTFAAMAVGVYGYVNHHRVHSNVRLKHVHYTSANPQTVTPQTCVMAGLQMAALPSMKHVVAPGRYFAEFIFSARIPPQLCFANGWRVYLRAHTEHLLCVRCCAQGWGDGGA